MKLLKSTAIGVSAIALSLGLAYSAKATPYLPGLTNLNFLSYTGTAPKAPFTSVDPTGWTGGTSLVFIATPGNSSVPSSGCGSTYLTTYGCPSTLAIKGGYNEVEADGNPQYESGFNYSISGLTAGTTYALSFYQAASQQTTFNGATTEQWIVSLGTSGLYVSNLSACIANHSVACVYTNADASASIVPTSLMNTPNHGLTDWNYVTMDLTADASTQLLSFLAWGNGGSTINEPPIVFLTGVNSPSGLTVPEPATLSLFGAGLLGLGGIMLRRRAKRNAAV